MADYIERTPELILAVNAGARAIENTKKYHGAFYLKDIFSDEKIAYVAAAKLLRSVEDIPAADVAPVVHGRWKAQMDSERSGFQFLTLPDHIVGYICSNCGEEAIEYIDDYFLPDYCPNCGAKMDGGNFCG